MKLDFAAWGRALKAFGRFLAEFWDDLRRVHAGDWVQVALIAGITVLYEVTARGRLWHLELFVLGWLGAVNALASGLRGVYLNDYKKMLDESHKLTGQVLNEWLRERATATGGADAPRVN